MGWRDLGWDAVGFPFTRVQAAGAWIALFFLLVWAERHHLHRVMRAAFSRHSPAMDDANEPGSYRWAGRVLLFGTLFLFAWSVASGMSLGSGAHLLCVLLDAQCHHDAHLRSGRPADSGTLLSRSAEDLTTVMGTLRAVAAVADSVLADVLDQPHRPGPSDGAPTLGVPYRQSNQHQSRARWESGCLSPFWSAVSSAC